MPARIDWLWRRSLFRKYITSFVGLVVFVLAISGATDVWITYRDTRNSALRDEAEKADSTALRVEQFIAELERQISWTTRANSDTPAQRASGYQLILQHTPAVASIARLDASGEEILKVSRSGVVTGGKRNLADTSAFKSATPGTAWFGPVTFTPNGPHMEVAMAQSGGGGGVTVADVELKYLSDILNGIQASSGVYAYITANGHLIAHTNSAIAVRNLDLSRLPQVAATRRPSGIVNGVGETVDGQAVLVAAAPIPRMSWSIFVEQPLARAYGPVYNLMIRLIWLFVLAFALCIAAGALLAWRMIVPIKAVQSGAARLAAGDFSHPIEVQTDDEIKALADEFNRMALQLQESYVRLEQKVEDRTRDIAQSVRELKALEEVGRAVAASLDVQDVLATIVSRAVELAKADGGAVYRFDRERHSFTLAEAHGLDPGFVSAIREMRIRRMEGVLGEVSARGLPIQIPHIAEARDFPLRAATLAAGFKSALIVPLLGAEGVLGALIVERRKTGYLSDNTVELMQTFAHHCVLAMHNAELFRQVEEKRNQLVIANDHKSQFFANMSHELRTPLNAVLGYAELLQDGLYGEMPERARQVLQRIQANGTHLLGLINDVLDLSKLEAGELALSLENYAMRNVVDAVVGATGSLAQTKGLAIIAEVDDDLPLGRGDERRLTQVLLNLVSNAIKFTEKGAVTIRAFIVGDEFELSVEDTGPGIAPEDQARIFEAFQQVDNTSTRLKGGTGLGLSISKRFVEMHGGTVAVTSTVGHGSIFRVLLPIRADGQMEAA